MRLVVKGGLPTLNQYINRERTNRFAAAKIKKEATEFVYYQVRSAPHFNGLADYTFTWTVPNSRTDPDNISFAQKFIFDALMMAKIIPNDSMKYVRSISHFFEIGEPQITIDIEEC